MKSRKPGRRARRRIRPLVRLLLFYVIILGSIMMASGAATVVLYGVAPPPATPLMLIRGYEDGVWRARWFWVRYDQISPNLVRAVIASEDARFCAHGGFDWRELRNAFETWRREGWLRGASTISNQTAKNLFLWPERSFIRKGLEAYFTLLVEGFWSKRRIMEMYLNVVEWGPGIYGAEAAAQAYFGKPAERLSIREAALMAAALPDPWSRSPERPSNDLRAIAGVVERRLRVTRLGENRPCP